MKNKIAGFFNTDPENVFLFAKGRVALYAALKGLGIGAGDDVIMSGYTCVMVPSAVMFAGAKPVYVDIDPLTYNIDPAKLDGAYTPRTKALIIQHTYGIAQDMDPVMQWADARRLPIIEDCCHAFGSRYKGRLCGTFGRAAFFSGQWNKPFSTGLGGILITEEELRGRVWEIFKQAQIPGALEEMRLAAQIRAYNALVRPKTSGLITLLYRGLSRIGVAAGSSSNEEFKGRMPKDYLKRMAGCQEREGIRNFNRINEIVEHRKKVASYYSEEISDAMNRVRTEDVLLRYPLRVGNKEALLKKALRQGVEIGSWFEIPLHPKGIDMAYFGYREGMCPESEKACREVINLPTHLRIDEKEAESVVKFMLENKI